MILQGNRVVGAICIPGELDNAFIEEFNNCYGPLRMQCAQIEGIHEISKPSNPDRFRLPAWFRHVWQPAGIPAAAPPSLPPMPAKKLG